MNFKNLNGVWKPQRFLITCLTFCLSEFCFQFEMFFIFDLQMHKTNLKSSVFEILFIGDYSSTF